MPLTKEFAKNPEAEVKVKCTQCGKAELIGDLVKEEPMPHPYETLTEGFFVCPHCGYKKHCYYMTELLRFDQVRMTKATEEWQFRKSISAWSAYKKRLEIFQNNFDRTQERYNKLFGLEKEASSDPGS